MKILPRINSAPYSDFSLFPHSSSRRSYSHSHARMSLRKRDKVFAVKIDSPCTGFVLTHWSTIYRATIGPFTREKKRRITQAAAYIRRELNHLYERGSYKTRRARINGLRLIGDCIAFVLVVIPIAELRELLRECGKIFRLKVKLARF